MKIKANNNLYIQKIDLLNIVQSHIPVPESIYLKAKKITDKNKYDFIKFSNQEEIFFLDGIPWLIDYNNIKDLTIEDISILINKLIIKRENIKEKLKTNPITDKIDLYIQIQSIELEINSLKDILLYKQGKTMLSLPKEHKKIKKK